MPARLFSLKVNEKAMLKLPGAPGEAFPSATQSEGTSRLPCQRGDGQAVPLAGTLPPHGHACGPIKGRGTAGVRAGKANRVAQHHPGHPP